MVGFPASQLRENVRCEPLFFFSLLRETQFNRRLELRRFSPWSDCVCPSIASSRMTFLSMGSIAGVGYDCSPELSVIAEEVQRVLLGERPDSILIANYASLRPMVDWRAPTRWHLQEAKLLPGSEVLYRPPTLRERDREYIFAAAGCRSVAVHCWIVDAAGAKAKGRDRDTDVPFQLPERMAAEY